MSKVIVYKRPGNSVEILRGTLPKKPQETEVEYLTRIAEKTYPGRTYVITELKHGWNKRNPLDAFDPIFREAWTIDTAGNLAIDLSTAKKIWTGVIREYRDKALKTLDIEFMMALGQGAMEDAKEIEAIKQLLRDIPKNIEQENFTSLNQLKSYWPTLLLPGPSFVLSEY